MTSELTSADQASLPVGAGPRLVPALVAAEGERTVRRYVEFRGGRLRRDTVSLWLSGVPAGCYRVVPLVGRCAGRA